MRPQHLPCESRRAGIKKQACFSRRCIHVKQDTPVAGRKRFKPNAYQQGGGTELDEVMPSPCPPSDPPSMRSVHWALPAWPARTWGFVPPPIFLPRRLRCHPAAAAIALLVGAVRSWSTIWTSSSLFQGSLSRRRARPPFSPCTPWRPWRRPPTRSSSPSLYPEAACPCPTCGRLPRRARRVRNEPERTQPLPHPQSNPRHTPRAAP